MIKSRRVYAVRKYSIVKTYVFQVLYSPVRKA